MYKSVFLSKLLIMISNIRTARQTSRLTCNSRAVVCLYIKRDKTKSEVVIYSSKFHIKINFFSIQ